MQYVYKFVSWDVSQLPYGGNRCSDKLIKQLKNFAALSQLPYGGNRCSDTILTDCNAQIYAFVAIALRREQVFRRILKQPVFSEEEKVSQLPYGGNRCSDIKSVIKARPGMFIVAIALRREQVFRRLIW